MSPAPETVRRPANPSASTSPSLSISTILSRAPRAPNETPAGGPFTADRRATSSIRRNFSGPRPAPFQRQTVMLSDPGSSPPATAPPVLAREAGDAAPTTALLLSALETRRRRIEELRNRQQAIQTSLSSSSSSSSNIATTIAEQWRRQRDALTSLQSGFRPVSSTTRNNLTPSPEIGPSTPPSWPSPPRLFLGEESESESDSDEDDDPEHKFPNSMNDIRRTPPPTFLTPNASPSNQSTNSPSSQQDDDSSRNAYTLSCRFCANVLTKRGMRARLVADARVHIWSTDEQPKYFPFNFRC
jgi:hypothetical protein